MDTMKAAHMVNVTLRNFNGWAPMGDTHRERCPSDRSTV